MPASGELWLSESWAHGAGNQSEISITFSRPAAAARLGVVVMSAELAGSTHGGTLFYVDYPGPGATALTVGARDATKVSRATASPPFRNVSRRQQTGLQGPPPSWPPYAQRMPLKPSDTTLTLRVFVDNTFAECFFQGGRAVLTRTVGKTPGPVMAAGVAAVGPPGAVVVEAKAWAMKSIWVSVQEVLATPAPRPRFET